MSDDTMTVASLCSDVARLSLEVFERRVEEDRLRAEVAAQKLELARPSTSTLGMMVENDRLRAEVAALEQFKAWAEPQITTHGDDLKTIASLTQELAEQKDYAIRLREQWDGALKLAEADVRALTQERDALAVTCCAAIVQRNKAEDERDELKEQLERTREILAYEHGAHLVPPLPTESAE